jgi:hypothetical protein
MRNSLFLPALMLVMQSTGCRPAAERKPPSETAYALDSAAACASKTNCDITISRSRLQPIA